MNPALLDVTLTRFATASTTSFPIRLVSLTTPHELRIQKTFCAGPVRSTLIDLKNLMTFVKHLLVIITERVRFLTVHLGLNVLVATNIAEKHAKVSK